MKKGILLIFCLLIARFVSGQAPVADFTASNTTICAGSCVSFLNQSTGATTFEWSFPGAQTASDTSADPSGICYTTAGSYDVQLIAFNGSLSDTQLMVGYIIVTPIVKAGTLTADYDTVCIGTTVNLALRGSAGSIQWQAGTDTLVLIDIPGATDTVYTSLPLTTDTYFAVALTACGLANTRPLLIHVVPPPVADTITATVDSICLHSGATSTLSVAGSVGGYQWISSVDSVNYTALSGATHSAYTTPVNLSRTTHYRVVYLLANCADTSDAYTITVKPAPSVIWNFTNNLTVVNFNATGSTGAASYQWNFGDGKTGTGPVLTHTYDALGSYNVCLVGTGANGCTDTLCGVLTLAPSGTSNYHQPAPLQVYPNPVKDVLTLAGAEIRQEGSQLIIYNSLGQKVLQYFIFNYKTPIFGVNTLPAGNYHLLLVNGERYFSGRFIKE